MKTDFGMGGWHSQIQPRRIYASQGNMIFIYSKIIYSALELQTFMGVIMRMHSLLSGLAAAALSSAAQAAVLVDIHAEGTATGPARAGGIIYNGGPITVDATFDLSKGVRITTPAVDRVSGGGANSPGEANVALDFLSGPWGGPFSSLAFVDGPSFSTMSVSFFDPTSTYAMFFVVTRPGDLFTSLNSIPTGEVCAGATNCFGKIVDPNGGTVLNNVNLTWSTISLSVRDTAVPEPATWALMILGFAGVGAALRRAQTPARHLV